MSISCPGCNCPRCDPYMSLFLKCSKLESSNARYLEMLKTAREGFSHLGGHLASYSDSDMGLYGLKGYAFDRRNEIDKALESGGEGTQK